MLPSTKYPNTSRTVSGASVAVFNNDVILAVDTTTLACSINLPEIAVGYWSTTWRLYIYDSTNNAAINNITINAGSGQKINNASSIVISVNGGGAVIQVINNTNFLASTTASGTAITSVTATSPITSSGGNTPVISTTMATNKLIGRATAGTGVMEEITLGTGLSLSGTTLNASTSGVTSVATAGLISGGTITSTGTITTSITTNKLVGRGTAGTGVMEEIILGTGLSLSGTTLNATGSSGGYATIQEEGSGLAAQTTMNFIGTSVTAANDVPNSRTNITVQSYNTVTDEGGAALTKRDTLNFVGNGISAVDDTTRTNITVNMAVIAYTVYVMKSGNDSTGIVERFDKPFLTIGAARTAALAYPAFSARTQNNRVKIIVESGEYAEGIVIDDFIDYDLGNSVISPPNTTPNTQACISDNGSAYTATTNGKYTAMIYGNATFNGYKAFPNDSWYGLYISNANSTHLNIYLECNQINTVYYDAIYMKTGRATVYANIIYNAINDLYTYNVIRLSSGVSNPPTLEVFNAKIYNNQTSNLAVNACVFFENSSGTAVNKCMLTNCQLGNYGSSISAITCAPEGALGIGQITLNNTTIFCSNILPSLSDGYASSMTPANAANILKTYAYNVYANYAANYANVGSSTIAGVVSVDTDVLFNQGNTI